MSNVNTEHASATIHKTINVHQRKQTQSEHLQQPRQRVKFNVGLLDVHLGHNHDLYGSTSCCISRDVCKSRIHDRRDYRDFRLVPWFSAIAVILCHGRDDYHQNMYNFDF